jgi:protein-tyrosine phosphatase
VDKLQQKLQNHTDAKVIKRNAYDSPYARWKHSCLLSYGRKAGLLKNFGYRLLEGLGFLRQYRQIRWADVRRLVFICSGNICRSAYAASKARKLGLPACSFGLQTGGGDPAHGLVKEIAAMHGLDLSEHISRPFSEHISTPGDLLIVMEPSQATIVRASARGSGAQTTLAGLWARQSRPYLQDPNNLAQEYFETCCTLLDQAVENMAQHWRSSTNVHKSTCELA